MVHGEILVLCNNIILQTFPMMSLQSWLSDVIITVSQLAMLYK